MIHESLNDILNGFNQELVNLWVEGTNGEEFGVSGSLFPNFTEFRKYLFALDRDPRVASVSRYIGSTKDIDFVRTLSDVTDRLNVEGADDEETPVVTFAKSAQAGRRGQRKSKRRR